MTLIFDPSDGIHKNRETEFTSIVGEKDCEFPLDGLSWAPTETVGESVLWGPGVIGVNHAVLCV